MSKKCVSFLLTGILLATAAFWMLLKQNPLVLLLAVALICGIILLDMLPELYRNPPKRSRRSLQAVISCVGAGSALTYAIVYFLRNFF